MKTLAKVHQRQKQQHCLKQRSEISQKTVAAKQIKSDVRFLSKKRKKNFSLPSNFNFKIKFSFEEIQLVLHL